jgi:hypothetical protein
MQLRFSDRFLQTLQVRVAASGRTALQLAIAIYHEKQ